MVTCDDIDPINLLTQHKLKIIYRSSYISAHVLLNSLRKPRIYRFKPTSLINSIIQEHEC